MKTKTAVIYATMHGTTEKAAKYIAENLSTEVDLIPLDKKNINLANYDTVILGTSIHMGVVLGQMKRFYKHNLEELKTKTLGLFICGMEPNLDRQNHELNTAYPPELQQKAKAIAFAGGEFLFDKMNFFQKTIIKAVTKNDKNVSQIHYDVLDHFISQMNKP